MEGILHIAPGVHAPALFSCKKVLPSIGALQNYEILYSDFAVISVTLIYEYLTLHDLIDYYRLLIII